MIFHAFLRYLYEQYKDVQKIRINFENRERQFRELYADATFPFDPLEPVWERSKVWKREEQSWLKTMETALGLCPVWNEYLKGIEGLGPVLACGLLGFIGDHRRFKGLRSLWHYCGLHVVNGEAPKRAKGVKVDWNPRFRTLMWQIGKSLIMRKNPRYYPLYVEYKRAEAEKHPELTKLHIHNRALRKVQKDFLKDLWRFLRDPETHLCSESQGLSGFSLHREHESHTHTGREVSGEPAGGHMQ